MQLSFRMIKLRFWELSEDLVLLYFPFVFSVLLLESPAEAGSRNDELQPNLGGFSWARDRAEMVFKQVLEAFIKVHTAKPSRKQRKAQLNISLTRSQLSLICIIRSLRFFMLGLSDE